MKIERTLVQGQGLQVGKHQEKVTDRSMDRGQDHQVMKVRSHRYEVMRIDLTLDPDQDHQVGKRLDEMRDHSMDHGLDLQAISHLIQVRPV